MPTGSDAPEVRRHSRGRDFPEWPSVVGKSQLNASAAFVAAWLPGGRGGDRRRLFRGNDGRVAHDFRGRLATLATTGRSDSAQRRRSRLRSAVCLRSRLVVRKSRRTADAVRGLRIDCRCIGTSRCLLREWSADGRRPARDRPEPEALQRVEGLGLFAPGLSPTIEPQIASRRVMRRCCAGCPASRATWLSPGTDRHSTWSVNRTANWRCRCFCASARRPVASCTSACATAPVAPCGWRSHRS